MVLSGIVKWFDKKRGYGFVESDKGDIFLHYSNFKDPSLLLKDKDIISFDIENGEKGLKAKNIIKVG